MNNLAIQTPTLIRPLAVANYWISRVAMGVAGALLAVMVVMILSQVFFRYVMNDSLPWTEEMAKFSMVWIAFLVAPWVYRENLNVSIQMFADAFPRKMRLVTELIITLLVVAVCAIFFRESLIFWQGGLTISASSVPIKLSYFYSCGPFAFALLCSVGVEKALVQIWALLSEFRNTPGVQS